MRSDAALKADELFWHTLHSGAYDDIPRVSDWKFAPVLEARITQAQENVAPFNGSQGEPVRPLMVNSAFACTGCHQQ
jgi:hypothetical protein